MMWNITEKPVQVKKEYKTLQLGSFELLQPHLDDGWQFTAGYIDPQVTYNRHCFILERTIDETDNT